MAKETPKKERLASEAKKTAYSRLDKLAKATGNTDMGNASKKKSIAEKPGTPKIPVKKKGI